ncbi:hypothetical protein TNCV_378551 [Trichonephila clavipes]|nr:hypothetical protein TNCV_378551 [Trichonephila clavipes]
MFDGNSAECYKSFFSEILCLVLAIIKSKLAATHHLSDYDCGRAVGRLEAGQSVTTLAAAMGVSKSVIWRFKKVVEGGNALRNHAEGQGRNTIPVEDYYVVLVVKRNRNFTPGRIAAYQATASSQLCQQEPSHGD